MEKRNFSNDGSIIKESPVLLRTADSLVGNKILWIEYGYTGFNANLRRYDRYYSSPFDKSITHAGKILLLCSPSEFWYVFSLLDNPEDKMALRESLKQVYSEYKQFQKSDISSNLSFDAFRVPYDKSCYVDTSEYGLYTTSIDISLDDNGRLESVQRQYRCHGKYGWIHEFKRGVTSTHSDGQEYISWIYHVLSTEVAEQAARDICQSDSEEYKRLLETINPDDEYYDSIVRGGATYSDDLQKLVRKCNL